MKGTIRAKFKTVTSQNCQALRNTIISIIELTLRFVDLFQVPYNKYFMLPYLKVRNAYTYDLLTVGTGKGWIAE